MYHSITFGDKNTFDDWGLVPKESPVFNPPAPKVYTVDIPGASSKLDFSEALTGYPTYENRTGSFEFYALNGLDGDEYDRDMKKLYSTIANHLHGKRMTAILEDDPFYYYEGRYAIESFVHGNSESEPRSTVIITYDVGPYKWYFKDSIDTNWLWDPFNFETDYISSGVYGSIPINTSWKEILFPRNLIEYAPICPEFIVSTTGNVAMSLRLVNPNLGIDETKTVYSGSTTIYDFIIYGENCKMYAKVPSGTGTLSIKFRRGGL